MQEWNALEWNVLGLEAAGVLAFLGAAAALGAAVALGVTWGWARTRRVERQRERRIEELLAGRNLASVLAESGYEYAHFQGEDGYRIYDRSDRERPVGWAPTERDAWLWILERTRGGADQSTVTTDRRP